MSDTKEKLEDYCDDNEDKLLEYLRERGKNHDYYKWYSSLTNIEKTISQRAFILSNGEGWNDPKDRKRFKQDEKFMYFGKCFSFSVSESVAMWMLYGKNKDKEKIGAMLNITKSVIKKIINEVEQNDVEIGWLVNHEFTGKAITLNTKDIFLQDVLYVGTGKNEDTRTIKRSNDAYKGMDEEILNWRQIVQKDYAWNYENECRLIVRVPINVIEGINPEKNITHLKIGFSDEIASRLKTRIWLQPGKTELEISESEKSEVKYRQSKLEMSWEG